ncbi:MAG: acylphosphatase [Cyclobacteriaceae bacterium]
MSASGILIEVSGRVQGVFFRASTKEFCDRLGIVGWVKNLPTGNVLIHAQGPIEQISKLKDWCRQGPPLSKVSEVLDQNTKMGAFKDFEIRY